jgi:hypothetical protein
MLRIISDFTKEVLGSPDNLIEELTKAHTRKTGSGLLRFDDIEKEGGKLTELKDMVCHAVAREILSSWRMRHHSGGGDVLMHSHNKHWTAIYYPNTHPAPLLLEGDDNYTPMTDELVILPAGEMHGVEENRTDTPRYSVVYLFDS